MKIRVHEEMNPREAGLKNSEKTAINKETKYNKQKIEEIKEAKEKLEALKSHYASINKQRDLEDENKRKL